MRCKINLGRIVIIGLSDETWGKLKLAEVRVKLFRDHAIHPFRDHSSRAEIGKLSSAAEILLMVLQSVQL